MKNFIIHSILALVFLYSNSYASTAEKVEANKMDYAQVVTQVYNDFFEKKNFPNMDQYFSQNVVLYHDFSKSMDYNAIRDHLIEQGTQCVKLSMLPFDNVLVSGNKIVVLYTQKCTDNLNKVHNKRVMSIYEINTDRKISNIWVVTHPEK